MKKLSIYLFLFFALFACSSVVAGESGKEKAKSLQDLIDDLKSGDTETRVDAKIELVREYGKKAVMPLIEVLQTGNKYARGYAAWALGDIGDKRAIPALIQALGDEDRGVIHFAMEALEEIGEDAKKAVRKALKHENDKVRARVAIMFAETGDTSMIKPLIEALKNNDYGICLDAMEALEKMGEDAEKAVRKALKHKNAKIRACAAIMVAETGDKSVANLLIEALKNEDWNIRGRAAFELGNIGEKRAVKPLIENLQDTQKDVRRQSARALGKIGDKSAVTPLIELFGDKEFGVRFYTAEAVGKLEKPNSKRIRRLLDSKDENVKQSAVITLAWMGDEDALSQLVKELENKDWIISSRIAYLMGEKKFKKAVQPLMKMIKGGNTRAAFSAGRALVAIGNKDVVKPLMEMVKEGQSRFLANHIVVDLFNNSTTEQLIEDLAHKDEIVRLYASNMFSHKKDKAGVPALINVLKDKSTEVRFSAIKVLGMIGDRRAIIPLTGLLKDENWNISLQASHSIQLLCNEKTSRKAINVIIKAMASFEDERSLNANNIQNAFAKIGKPAVKPLIKALKNKNKNIVRSAVRALGFIGDGSAIEPVTKILKKKDADKEMRNAAAEALGFFADKRSFELLTQAFNDKSTRAIVTWALGRLRDPRALDPLMTALKDPDEEVRKNAVEALGMTGDERALESLVKGMHDGSLDRDKVIRAIGRIGGGKAVKILIKALETEESWVSQYHAAAGLFMIGDRSAVKPLIKALDYDNTEVSKTAAVALGWIGDKSAVEPLIRALKDSDSLTNVMKIQNVTKALGDLQDKRAVKPLVKLLKHDFQQIRRNAVWALGKIGDKSIAGHIQKALKDREAIVRRAALVALGRLGDKSSLPLLLDALKNKDGSVRSDAAIGLGFMGDKKAVAPVRKMWKKDNDKSARIGAAFAIFKLTGKQDAYKFLLDALNDRNTVYFAVPMLGYIGDKKAVPHVAEAMKRANLFTYYIFVNVLEDLTGQRFGENYRRWMEWYDKNKDK